MPNVIYWNPHKGPGRNRLFVVRWFCLIIYDLAYPIITDWGTVHILSTATCFEINRTRLLRFLCVFFILAGLYC